jgi:hypothetical protein
MFIKEARTNNNPTKPNTKNQYGMNKTAYAFFEKVAKVSPLIPAVVIPFAFIIGIIAAHDGAILDGVTHGYLDITSLESRMIKATADEYLIIARISVALCVAMAALLTLILVGRWVRDNGGVSLE